MAGLLTIIASIFTLAIVLTILPIAKRRLSLRIASRRRGCAWLPRVPSKDPLFGIDNIIIDVRNRQARKKLKESHLDFTRYGKTYELYAFGQRQVITCDPRNVQFILSTEADKFGNAPIRDVTVSMIGRGIINSDAEIWKQSRGAIMPTFTKSRIANQEFFERHFERFLSRLPTNGRTVDLKPLFDQMILDASSEFIFGESFDSQLGDEHSIEGNKFLVAFQEAQAVVGMRIVLGRLTSLLPDQRVKKYRENCDLVRTYTQRFVERALERQSRAGEETKDDETYILAYELAKKDIDKDELCDQLLNVFFGGRDPPAIVLGHVFFCLARNPEVWRKIRKETEGLRVEDLSFEKLKSLRYVQHAVNEALRLLPMVPIIGRTCLAETGLPYGGGPDGDMPVCVMPGDSVRFNVYAMHREPSVFGPDVEAYRPERWKDIRPFWNYLPFSGGARHCPAQQLALFWVSYTVVRLSMEFKEVQNRDPVHEYVEHLRLNMESSNGIKVALVRA